MNAVDNGDNTHTVTQTFDGVKLERMLSELSDGDKVSVNSGEDYTFDAEASGTTTADYQKLATEHTPPTGSTNSGTYEYADGSTASFKVDASGNLTMGELTTNNPDGKAQASLTSLFEQVGSNDGSTGEMAITIDGATYSGQQGVQTVAATDANSNLSASSVTDFTSLSAALTATDEIDSVGGTIGAMTINFVAEKGGTPVTVDFTAVEAASSTEGVQYTDTATTAEVLSEASGNTVDVDLANGVTSATVAFDTNGELDADKALTTTQSVETTYRVNQETGDVTVKESNGEGKYAVEAGATAYVSSDGQLTTSETSPGERTEDPLAALDSALAQVDSLRSDLGAIQNRFESAITNLSTNETNLSSARSRIEDADYATEVANMTKNQILQQAGTSVLAQANQLPQSVLSLLG